MHKKLFIPGPVDVREDILKKMATPLIGHRTKEASNLQRGITEKLQKVFLTDNIMLLSTSSGSGLMEGSIRSFTNKKAAVFSTGAFGDRWYEMAISNRVPADIFKSELGEPTTVEMVDAALKTGMYDVITLTHNETSTSIMNPIAEIGALLMKKYPDILFLVDAVSSMAGIEIKTDEWGIDVCITSTQKALGLPPGLSICSVSERAIEAGRKVESRGTYLDIVSLYDTVKKKNHQYPFTPSLSHMFALDYQLDRILEETLEVRYKRHDDMANIVRNWAKEHFALLVKDEKYLSKTLTTILNTKNISIEDLNNALAERGFIISNGYGSLKNKTFRISHMADYTLLDIKDLLDNINDILKL